MEVNKELSEMVNQLGLEDIPRDEYGYPSPGRVVKHFREKMFYSVPGSKNKKHWTQKDLAKLLDISEVSIRLMETQNVGLDSIERRRVLATLLRIPPILLGLSHLDFIEDVENVSSSILPKKITKSSDILEHYRSAFTMFNDLYRIGDLGPVITGMESFIKTLEHNIPSSASQDDMFILWEYHILCAKSYGYDLSNWNDAFKHLEKAFEIAAFLDSVDLKAASFCYSGEFHLSDKKIALAKNELETALIYAKKATTQVQARTTAIAALSFTLFGLSDMGERTRVHWLIENSEGLYNQLNPANNLLQNINSSKTSCLSQMTETYLLLGSYNKATETLDRAENEASTSDKRRLNYLNILRSELNIKGKKPNYEKAISLLTDVVEENKTTTNDYHIQYVRKLYKLLLASPVKNSLELAELGMELRDLKS